MYINVEHVLGLRYKVNRFSSLKVSISLNRTKSITVIRHQGNLQKQNNPIYYFIRPPYTYFPFLASYQNTCNNSLYQEKTEHRSKSKDTTKN